MLRRSRLRLVFHEGKLNFIISFLGFPFRADRDIFKRLHLQVKENSFSGNTPGFFCIQFQDTELYGVLFQENNI